MKKLFRILTLILLANVAFAQNSNLVIFTEQGEKFYLILNGIRQNGTPETNVKVTGLNQPGYKLKIIFQDVTLGEFDKNIMLDPGNELVANVKRNKDGKYVLRYQSSAPIPQVQQPVPSQQVVMYSATPVPITNSTTTTTTVTDNTGSNVNMGMNGMGINMNININDGMTGGTQTTTTTTQTTTTNTNYNSNPNSNVQQTVVYEQPYNNNTNTNVYVMPGYSGPTGCAWPMKDNDFQQAKNTISSKSFEDSKLQIAKQVISSNCLFASQVREVMQFFSFEDSRLNFAKYAYNYTFDIGNYFKVNDAFQFESSIDDLNNHINSQKR